MLKRKEEKVELLVTQTLAERRLSEELRRNELLGRFVQGFFQAVPEIFFSLSLEELRWAYHNTPSVCDAVKRCIKTNTAKYHAWHPEAVFACGGAIPPYIIVEPGEYILGELFVPGNNVTRVSDRVVQLYDCKEQVVADPQDADNSVDDGESLVLGDEIVSDDPVARVSVFIKSLLRECSGRHLTEAFGGLKKLTKLSIPFSAGKALLDRARLEEPTTSPVIFFSQVEGKLVVFFAWWETNGWAVDCLTAAEFANSTVMILADSEVVYRYVTVDGVVNDPHPDYVSSQGGCGRILR